MTKIISLIWILILIISNERADACSQSNQVVIIKLFFNTCIHWLIIKKKKKMLLLENLLFFFQCKMNAYTGYNEISCCGNLKCHQKVGQKTGICSESNDSGIFGSFNEKNWLLYLNWRIIIILYFFYNYFMILDEH